MQWHGRFYSDVGQLIDSLEHRSGNKATERLVESAFGPQAARAVREDAAPAAPTREGGRIVTFGTASGAMASMAAHASTNFGSPRLSPPSSRRAPTLAQRAMVTCPLPPYQFKGRKSGVERLIDLAVR
jgi:hypothetical protein